MTTQLKLPFTEMEVKHNHNLQYYVQELRNMNNTAEMVRLANEFVQDFDMVEHIDDVYLAASCINLCSDIYRKNLNCWLVYKGNKAIGFLVAICMGTWYNKRIIAEQKLWFVSKQYRGTRAAFLLIKAYEQWARINGATHIYTGTANERYAEQNANMFTKLGFKRVGSLHVKEV